MFLHAMVAESESQWVGGFWLEWDS